MLLNRIKQKISSLFQLEKIPIAEYFSFGNRLLTNNSIGLEINSEYIKFLKLHPGTPCKIENFAIIPLSSGLVVKNEIKNPGAIANILKENFMKQDINSKNVVLAVNNSSIITKTITVNSRLNSDEIEARVWSEANRLFPNLISDIYLDFVVMTPSSHEIQQLDVLVVACRKEHIRPYIDLMRLAELSLKAIDVNCYALERSLSMLSSQYPQLKTLALLNLGFSLITLIVIHENNHIYSYEMSYDGHVLIQPSKDGAQIETKELLKNSLSVHLKHTMQFFYTNRPHVRLEQIILSGDCAAIIPNVIEFIKQETGKETVLAEPFKDMELAPHFTAEDKEKLRIHAPSFLQCCGLALSKIYL